MIRLTKLNKSQFVLNSELIETIESTPDTIITLTNGKKYVVTESVEEVVGRVIQYKGNIFKFSSNFDIKCCCEPDKDT